MFFGLLMICYLVNIVCWIIVLVKIFQSGNVGLGILGIICGIFTFIYGWVKVDEYGIRQVMLVWSVVIIASIILQMMMPHNVIVIPHQ